MLEGESENLADFKAEQEINPAEFLAMHQRSLIEAALRTKEGLECLQAWRELDQAGRGVKRARQMFDRLAAYDNAVKEKPDLAEPLALELEKAVASLSQRQDQLLAICVARKLGRRLPPVFPEVNKIFQNLSQAESSEGVLNAIDLLASDKVPFKDKKAWFEAQILPALKFLDKKDLAEARRIAKTPPTPELIEAKQNLPQNNLPPTERNSLAPSMEEMERAKEGEAGAYFTIAPYYGGYYKEGSFDRWNKDSLEWERDEREWSAASEKEIKEESLRVMRGTVRGNEITPLPLPYNFSPDIKSLTGEKIQIVKEKNGNYAIKTPQEGLINFSAEIGRGASDPNIPPSQKLDMPSNRLSLETGEKLKEVKGSGRTVLDQARMIKAYVRKILQYSNDSAMNEVYRGGDSTGYFQRIEQGKKADCDVANTFFIALLSRLDIPARLVSGHYVKAKDKSGSAVISGGTGHAWTEVWDGFSWHRLDATPPGDANMDEEETDELPDDKVGDGDFGEQEARELSDEELAELISQAKRNLEEKEESPQEKKELAFASQAGCTPQEAKQILNEIESARNLRDKQGRLIKTALTTEFQKIIQENLVEGLQYKSPIRLSQGEELSEPVEAMLDLKTGEADPTGFARHERKIKREQAYGGFDAIFAADKSGSMSETSPASGLPKYQEQRQLIFLLMDALYGVSQEFKRQRIKLISPLDVRAALISFHAGGAKVEMPLGQAWGPKEQYQVWHSLGQNVGGGTPDHLGLEAVKDLIEADQKELLKKSGKKGATKDRLRLVLVSADGGSDDAKKTMLAKETLKKIAIVKAAGIGSGAKAVESAYYPDGANLPDFGSVPDWAAKNIIATAKQLYPKKIKR